MKFSGIKRDKCCKCGAGLGSYSQLMLGKDNIINPYKIDFWCCRDCYKAFEKIKKERKLPSKLNFQEFWLHVFFEDFLKHYQPKVKVMLV
jgi:hypothetical protein